MLQQGTVLSGKYRLVDKLGEGGMGAVWLAENLSIESEVAVKVLHTSFTGDPTAVQRFRNEARAAARIGHPSIVQVFDFGEAEDGAPYMVMERMLGESLASRIEREGALPRDEAVTIVTEVLAALDAAHAKDILHRDLKPENIFLAQVGDRIVPKILDFGVSKFLGDDAERVRMTRTGTLVGTPAYMSPEQARGLDNVDLRSDIWAMGVILFEVISGRLPFDASNYNAMLIQIATSSPPHLTTVVDGIDPMLADITACALCHDRHGRFKSARAMRDALVAWTRGEPVTLGSSNSTTPPPPPVRISSIERNTPVDIDHADTLADGKTPVFVPRRQVPFGWIAAAVATLVGATGVGWSRLHPTETTPPPVVAPATQTLDIDGLPVGATVMVNDQPTTPPIRTTAGTTYHIVVHAPGFQDWQVVLDATSSPARRVFGGVRLPEAPPTPTATPDAGAAPAPRPTAHTTGHRPNPTPNTPAGAGAHPTAPNSLIATDPDHP